MFYTAGINSAIWIYEIVVIVSILFLKLFEDHLGGFIFTQITINALFFIAVIVINTVSGRIHDSNVKTSENLQNGEYDKPKRGGL